MNLFSAKTFLITLVLILLCSTLFPSSLSAQAISITATGASYSENFDGMGATGTSYLTGWTGVRYAGTGVIGQTLNPVADYGSQNSGNVYNAGPSGGSDRSLGMLSSASTMPRIGAQYVNNTGVTITSINFTGLEKQWRSGSSTAVNEIDTFAISFNATSLSTGTWTYVTGMNLNEILTASTSAGAVDGTQAANQANLSASINGLNWPNGGTMWVRWTDHDDAGSDCELAIDNFTMAFNVAAPVYGYGTAAITPSYIQGAIAGMITVTVKGQASHTLTNANIVVPGLFSWSQSPADVILTGGGSPSVAVSGDTIYISGMSVSGTDSIQVAINSITPPDSTNTFVFPTMTGVSPDSIHSLASQPSVLVYGTPHAIGDIKANDVNGIPLWQGKWVTILGIVTVGAEYGSPSYVQDATGGIAVYGVITSGQIAIGDEVEIVGLVSPYAGLNELASPIIIRKVSSGNVVTPLVVNCSQISNDGQGGVEQYEGLLVRINQVTVTTLAGGAVGNWASATNYLLHDASDTTEIRIDNNVTSLINAPAPQGPFDLIAIVGQYKTTSPYIGGYQLMPRTISDVISSGPIFSAAPYESNLQPTSMRINWATINNGTSRVRYGLTTSYELGVVAPDNNLGTTHAVDLTGLTPSTIYHVQAYSDDGAGDTSLAGDLVVSSASPPASTGQMNVYFNFNVNTSVSLGENAQGNVDLVSKILTRIDNAHRSIDLALYSLSGGGYGDLVASHLIAARARGVSVRVICEHDNLSYSGFQTLKNNGVPLIDDTYDAVWNGAGLMHNKFFVIDGRGGAPESVWVWGGSWNPTIPGTTQDHQNSVEIQDQALAGAYTMEFNQMWGSPNDVPNAANSRFGARKLDITPHNFNINGVPVSSYFSPSDHTTSHITDMIAKAQHSVATCILTFTRSDIADSMLARKNAGDKVRVVVDNSTDQGTQYPFLQSSGVDIHIKGFSTGLLHHKYTTVDADQSAGTSYLETGSHNYSSAAENSNDENSLIFQSKRLANLYLQEFAARYYEAGGTDSIHVASSPIFGINKSSISFDTVLTTTSKTDSFMVTNSGNLPLVIAPLQISNGEFTVNPDSATVAPAGAQKFYVTFTPNATGSQNGTIVFSFNAQGSPDTVTVQGVGRSGAHPLFHASPSPLVFGPQPIGSTTVDTLTVSNPGSATLHLSSIVSSDAHFTLTFAADTIAAGQAKQYTVSFSSASADSFQGKLTFVHDAASSPDSLMMTGVAVDTPITRSVTAQAGWNLVALPVRPPSANSPLLFPTASSKAFGYGTGYYVPQNDTLLVGNGYWLKFDTAILQPMSGLPIRSDSIAVVKGWNLVGGISSPTAAADVTSNPPGIVISGWFGYSGGYDTADTLQPGAGYWVRAGQSGKLFASGGSRQTKQVPKKTTAAVVHAGLNTLTVTDAAGRKQILTFGAGKTDAATLSVYDLPPVPPQGAFDVRFSSGRTTEFYPKVITESHVFPLTLQGVTPPVKFQWAIDSKDTKAYNLKDDNGLTTHRMTGTGELTVNQTGDGTYRLVVANAEPLPTRYALEQNYPNPFNPTTTIEFALPKASRVTLTVYSVLGEQVASLLENAPYDPGTWSVRFDGSKFASGVYYYRILATGDANASFHEIRKFMLLK